MSLTSKIVMVTCYDATFARLCAESLAIDYLLVGDSLGMVIGGEDSTLNVTLEQMVYHTRAVARGLKAAEVTKLPALIADFPVNTYRTVDQAIETAKQLVESGAEIVKLEGPCTDQVRALRSAGYRVCAHIGLTPQSIQNYKVQGRNADDAARLKQEALLLEAAGAEMIVLEMIPALLAQEITQSLRIPTIGIGAGPECAGQVLVLYDLLGLNSHFDPKFLKKYANAASLVRESLAHYAQEVRTQKYPDEKHSFT